ncbi:uncharacterized protein LOC116313258 isoform X1 [Oreochromis aureus]|uniref:uncharacterized protein LOC116313258 isoform X1 n=1 Tax=Oreochromis aureus TaxID=47969 RepID=UPI001953F08A|nr:uncharacterized protein LOC116313258 isoform X1 [Oreochromis aureus]
MDSNRRVCNWISYTVFLFGYMTGTVLPGKNPTTSFNLECTYDFDQLMQCQLELQNCTEYSMTLPAGYASEENCTVQQCGIGKCCCSFKLMRVLGEILTAKVWKDGNIMESKAINVTESIKPKTPEIKSVTESEGNFEVRWTSNITGFLNDYMTAELTYYKKGETEKTSEHFKPVTTTDGLNYYVIKGQDLDPSSAYVVSVKSFLSLSDKFSDSSEEWEFETGPSHHNLMLVIIITLSIAAVILSVAKYGCYAKLRKIYYDAVPKATNPSFLNINPSEQKVRQVLKLEDFITTPICVETLIPDDSELGSKMSLTDTSCGSLQQSSGISTGSSDLSYTNTESPVAVNGEPSIAKAAKNELCKIFPNICPILPVSTSLPAQSNNTQGSELLSETGPGVSAFENKTYSFLIPGCLHQTMTDKLKTQGTAEMLCDSNYHPSNSGMERCPDHQVPACQVPAQLSGISPSAVSPLLSTAMSYQEVPICVPIGSHSVLAVDDDYQEIPSLVREPDVSLLEHRNTEHKEHLDKLEEESLRKSPESILSPVVPVQDGQRVSELQVPTFCFTSTNCSVPIITESGYQSV